jgi:branched-chain amino acid transport system ATP-binding protein
MNTLKVSPENNDPAHVEPGQKQAILDVVDLSRSFGGIQALNRVTFSLDEGSIVSIIGPNGAGKSTFINVITGIYPPVGGHFSFRGQNITGLQAHQIAGLGIGRTFQYVEPFVGLTVLENAMVGCHSKSRANMFDVGLRLPSARKEEKRIKDEAIENLKMVGLEHRITHSISSLPLGERKLLGIARALGLRPKLLMLDEPAGGLATHEVNRLAELIHELKDKGLTVVIVEHNMSFVMSISERVIVFNFGQKIADSTPDIVRANPAVIKAYLGEEA